MKNKKEKKEINATKHTAVIIDTMRQLWQRKRKLGVPIMSIEDKASVVNSNAAPVSLADEISLKYYNKLYEDLCLEQQRAINSLI